MYLVSAYFDEGTEKRIRKYVNAVAQRTGCRFMTDNDIPPHMTIAQPAAPVCRTGDTAAGQAGKNESRLTCAGDGAQSGAEFIAGRIDRIIRDGIIGAGYIDVVSFGVFKPRVMFLTPVLNEYLFRMSASIDTALYDSSNDHKPAIDNGRPAAACSGQESEENKNTPKGSKNKQNKNYKNSYRPFSWLPHITIARGLSEPQMRQAFSCMQADFEVFTARIERIGLAESRPYTDIKVWEL